MGDLFYALAVIFTIIWAVLFFGFDLGGFTHLLLGAALTSVAIRLLTRKAPINL